MHNIVLQIKEITSRDNNSSTQPSGIRGLFDMLCVVSIILKEPTQMVKLTLHPRGWKYMYITSVCESTSGWRHRRLS